MDTFVWRDDYSVGYTPIDEQHQELFKRINAFGNALWEGQGKELLAAHLRFLADYVVSHFQTEEGLMTTHKFPLYEVHKPVHDAFVQEVSSVLNRIADAGLDTATAILVFEKSCDWTRAHVRGMDQELGRFLGAQRNSTAA
ncbi:MAG: hemerythrin family protein [Desulfomonile tiedjei]|nr:hemerythrin family protein [Desulfomonile tiedjei]